MQSCVQLCGFILGFPLAARGMEKSPGTGQPSQPASWAGLEGWCDAEGGIQFHPFETNKALNF